MLIRYRSALILSAVLCCSALAQTPETAPVVEPPPPPFVPQETNALPGDMIPLAPESAPPLTQDTAAESPLAPEVDGDSLKELSKELGIEQTPTPPIEAAASPAPPTPAAEARSETSLLKRIPPYQKTRPKWAFEISGAINGLGKSPSIPQMSRNGRVRGMMLQAEYQPKFIQRYGVLGIGPTAAVYPVYPKHLTPGLLSFYSFGAQVRYQLRYLREQILVPVVGYEMRYLTYSTNVAARGHFLGQGAFGGAMLLLNPLAPSDAADFFVEHGISRTYLVGEVRNFRGNDDRVNVSGQSLYLGIRFEY